MWYFTYEFHARNTNCKKIQSENSSIEVNSLTIHKLIMQICNFNYEFRARNTNCKRFQNENSNIEVTNLTIHILIT